MSSPAVISAITGAGVIVALYILDTYILRRDKEPEVGDRITLTQLESYKLFELASMYNLSSPGAAIATFMNMVEHIGNYRAQGYDVMLVSSDSPESVKMIFDVDNDPYYVTKSVKLPK